MTDHRADPELITRARAGDPDAFGVLWTRHQGAAMKVARALTDQRAEAEDVVAETFVAVHRAIAGGAGPDVHFRAYLLTAVRHTVARRRSGEARTEATDTLPEALWFDDPDLDGDGPSERSVALEAYEALPERYRAVLWHAEVEGEPHRQVAEAIGVSPAAVGQLLVRARRQLRRTYLQKHLDHARPVDAPPACRDVQGQLGGYFTETLSARDNASVRAHLDTCDSCGRLLLFADEVGAGLRSCVLPAVVGGAASARYLTAGHHLGALGKAAAVLRHHASQQPAAAAVTAAAVAIVAVGAGGLAAQHASASTTVAAAHRSRPAAVSGPPVRRSGSRPTSPSATPVAPSAPTDPPTVPSAPVSIAPVSGTTVAPTTSLAPTTTTASPATTTPVGEPRRSPSSTTTTTTTTTTTVPRPTTPTTTPPTTAPSMPPTTRCQFNDLGIVICINSSPSTTAPPTSPTTRCVLNALGIEVCITVK